MTDTSSFAKLVPGFEFMQGLVKNAGAALPGIGQWVAPTLDPAELEKRIEELRTVQFWLEQNARMLATTIQALEVQRMTLSTLKTMNVQLEGLRDSLKITVPEAAPPPEPEPEPAAAPAAANPAETPAAAQSPAGLVDPMQWWSALTQQFGQLAAAAVQDGGKAAAPAGDSASSPTRPSASRKTAAAKKPAARKRPAAKKAASRP